MNVFSQNIKFCLCVIVQHLCTLMILTIYVNFVIKIVECVVEEKKINAQHAVMNRF